MKKSVIIFVLFTLLLSGCKPFLTQVDKQNLIATTFNIPQYQIAWAHKYGDDNAFCIVKMNDGSIWQIRVGNTRILDQYLLFPPTTNIITNSNIVLEK